MIKECCQKPENLYVVERRSTTGRVLQNGKMVDSQADIVVNKCRVCGCRHIQMAVDPIHVGITLK